MSGRARLLMLAVSSILAGCATLETPAGQPVPADVYNREMSRQGAMYYCGDGTCDRPPMLVRAAALRYPAAALHAGRAGEASVLFEIDEQHTARLEPPLAHDVLLRERQHAAFAREADEIVLRHAVARGA